MKYLYTITTPTETLKVIAEGGTMSLTGEGVFIGGKLIWKNPNGKKVRDLSVYSRPMTPFDSDPTQKLSRFKRFWNWMLSP